MSHKVSWDRGASQDAVTEAVRRVFARDGISRHVYSNDKIMKYDWRQPEEIEDLQGEELEAHIRKLMSQVDNNDE